MLSSAIVVAGTLLAAEDQFESRELKFTGGEYRDEVFKYRLLKPTTVESGKRYPLVVFLHGAGERGSDNAAQLEYLPKQMASEPWLSKFPCFLLAPQCRDGKKWVEINWSSRQSTPQADMTAQMQVVVQAMDQLIKDEPIDADRVYLTGLSMGGYGTWDLASRMPERFAAVAPICGGGDEQQAEKLAKLPIWAWHGDADNAVPVERTRSMIAAIKQAGGSPQYTELPGVGHNSWTPAYSGEGGLVEWMFKQRRK
jgi:predicted peptidase